MSRESMFHFYTSLVSDGDYDDKYAEYIMDNACGDRVICDGDMLIVAMEEGYLKTEFINSLVDSYYQSLSKYY